MSRSRLLNIRNSGLSTLATAPPPSSSARPVLSSSPPRLPHEAPKHQSQHSQLALGQPTTSLQPSLFPSGAPVLPLPFTIPPAPRAADGTSAHAHPAPDAANRATKRPRLRYQLDAGAYGIPKHRSCPQRAPPPPVPGLSVQVGEDAYFLLDHAMGVADGVGGWARTAPAPFGAPTPSAMFARRLMHYCAAEVQAARPPSAPFSFEHPIKPSGFVQEALDDELADLAEGINVLQILERAYDSTVRAHAPVTTGSSTALIAVLDHAPMAPPASVLGSPEPDRNYAVGALWRAEHSVDTAQAADDEVEGIARGMHSISVGHAEELGDAVVHIAHLGDCMGMLVRGDKIAWRSDEMWWGVSLLIFQDVSVAAQLGYHLGSQLRKVEAGTEVARQIVPIGLPGNIIIFFAWFDRWLTVYVFIVV